MDLSTAIRLGAEKRRQYSGAMFGRPYGTTAVGSCAMGAAYEALTGEALRPLTEVLNSAEERSYAHATMTLRHAFPVLTEMARCPVPGEGDCAKAPDHEPRKVHTIIEHLNDVHDWTREQIADWLETR